VPAQDRTVFHQRQDQARPSFAHRKNIDLAAGGSPLWRLSVFITAYS
jgi:hypothetical protein